MKNLVLLGSLVAASFTATAQVMPTKQQLAAQRDSIVTDRLWGPGAHHSNHDRRIFEIPPGVRPGLPQRTKKSHTPKAAKKPRPYQSGLFRSPKEHKLIIYVWIGIDEPT